MKKRIPVLLLLIPLLVFTTGMKKITPLPAPNNQTYVEMTDYSTTLETPDGDIITIEGTMMYLYHLTDQGQHPSAHVRAAFINFTVKSQITGETYRVIQSSDYILKLSRSGDAYVTTDVRKSHLVREGTGTSYLFQQVSHLVLKPDGTVERVVDHENIQNR